MARIRPRLRRVLQTDHRVYIHGLIWRRPAGGRRSQHRRPSFSGARRRRLRRSLVRARYGPWLVADPLDLAGAEPHAPERVAEGLRRRYDAPGKSLRTMSRRFWRRSTFSSAPEASPPSEFRASYMSRAGIRGEELSAEVPWEKETGRGTEAGSSSSITDRRTRIQAITARGSTRAGHSPKDRPPLTPSSLEKSRRSSRAIELACQAGELLRAGLGSVDVVRHKGAIDLVTDFDPSSKPLLADGTTNFARSLPTFRCPWRAPGKGPRVWEWSATRYGTNSSRPWRAVALTVGPGRGCFWFTRQAAARLASMAGSKSSAL